MPSEAMVTPVGGYPVPRVIALGVARSTGQKLTRPCTSTGFRAAVGTLKDMGPERAERGDVGEVSDAEIWPPDPDRGSGRVGGFCRVRRRSEAGSPAIV